MGKINTAQRHLPVKLRDDELIKFSKALARNNQEWAEVELEKKVANADFQSRINRFKSEIEVVSLKISTGVEYRNVDCKYTFNVPKKDMKTLTRTDTGQKVSEERLNSEDVQMLLELKKQVKKGENDAGK